MSRQVSLQEEIRAACRRSRIPFDVVKQIKEAMQEAERLSRAREFEVRQVAWRDAAGANCAPFWRFGFRARWGRKYDEADQTVVPRYDEIQQVVASEFPEYSGSDGEQKLWELLFSDYRKLTKPADLWNAAMKDARKQRRNRKAAATVVITEGDF